jgi:hypothetical protein
MASALQLTRISSTKQAAYIESIHKPMRHSILESFLVVVVVVVTRRNESSRCYMTSRQFIAEGALSLVSTN